MAACGSRSELYGGAVAFGGSGGSAGTAAGSGGATGGSGGSTLLPEPECMVASDCPPPPPEQCGTTICDAGVCRLTVSVTCDDDDPCTLDFCSNDRCRFEDGRLDADGDGYLATGNREEPNAAYGCGNDCDDTRSDVHPGADELCDGVDNDCDVAVDEGAGLFVPSTTPVRVTGPEFEYGLPGGLAFDGERFGATFTGDKNKARGYFVPLSRAGTRLAEPQTVTKVNAASSGGALVWDGRRYLTAYQDARQDQQYEVYFNILNAAGERLVEDVRLTDAGGFSLDPALVWTGTESVVVWSDRRPGTDVDGAIFGQRLSADGALIGGNVQLASVQGESPSAALAGTRLGVVFTNLDQNDVARLGFLQTSPTNLRTQAANAVTTIDFIDPNDPRVIAVGQRFVVTFVRFDGNAYGPSVFATVIGPGGIEVSPRALTGAMTSSNVRSHATLSLGDRFVTVWSDDAEGNYELYLQIFDARLEPITERQRLTATALDSVAPRLSLSSDGALGVLFNERGQGEFGHVYFTRAECAPAPDQ
jgi:hypothetical protein